MSENEGDGGTVDRGLAESMVGYLFDGSFKKQIKCNQFVRPYKEGEVVVSVILEPGPEACQPTEEPGPTSGCCLYVAFLSVLS